MRTSLIMALLVWANACNLNRDVKDKWPLVNALFRGAKCTCEGDLYIDFLTFLLRRVGLVLSGEG